MKVLISSRSFGKKDNSAIRSLKQSGFETIINPYGRKPTEDELIELIDDSVVGIIAGTEQITKKVIKHAKSLKVISRYGVGIDNIDIETAEELGVSVKSTPEAPAQAVAELALALILNLLRKINQLDKNIRLSRWEPVMGNLLSGKTVGIIGLGRIGKLLVELIEPFKIKFQTYELNPDDQFITQHDIDKVSLKKLISESDIITLHIPLTEETRNIIGKNELSQMQKHAILINTARGGLIDEDSLVEALVSGTIAGAAIDAFYQEPYEGKLKELNNVILSPHIGSFTLETRKSMEKETVENLINTLKENKII